MTKSPVRITLAAFTLALAACQPATPPAQPAPPAPEPESAPDWSPLGQPSNVRLRTLEGGYQLLRNGEPFFIKGVGGHTNLDRLAALGGNAIRTWDGEGIDDILAQAHANGIAVCIGIWLEHERHGYDYNDPATRQKQLDKVQRIVTRYQRHPALLAWGVGNEVELGGNLDTALRAIEEAAALIKTLDSQHPTVAIIAEIGDDKAQRIAAQCLSIDILGVNSYGGAASVPDRLLAQGYSGPYLITEFGPLGHWEGPSTPWGAPIEQASHQKALFYSNSYRSAVEAHHPGRCLGSFAFLWGHKQETTATWFGLLLPTGETTEAVDYLSRFWTGKPLEANAPRVSAIRLADADPAAIKPGQALNVSVSAFDPDKDPLDIQWIVKHESTDRRSGGDAEAQPDAIPDLVTAAEGLNATITAPQNPGAYRIFVFVRDGTGRAGTANIPFLVTD